MRVSKVSPCANCRKPTANRNYTCDECQARYAPAPEYCRCCGADLSRESHQSWCENAPDPYAEYESEEW